MYVRTLVTKQTNYVRVSYRHEHAVLLPKTQAKGVSSTYPRGGVYLIQDSTEAPTTISQPRFVVVRVPIPGLIVQIQDLS